MPQSNYQIKPVIDQGRTEETPPRTSGTDPERPAIAPQNVKLKHNYKIKDYMDFDIYE